MQFIKRGDMKKFVTLGVLALATLGLAACSRNITITVQPPQAPASTAPALSYTVSCKMGNGPYDDYVEGKSWVPEVTVTNTGSASFPLPDLAANDSPLSFAVKFFDSSGSQTAEDDGYGDLGHPVTVQPGHSFTLPNPQINGTVNDNYPGATTCTATADGGL
jgi:hypothetical protein